MKHAPTTIYRAAAIQDAAGTSARPGSIVVRNGRVIAAGHPDEIPRRLLGYAEMVDRPQDLILPALVNAHAHLDLTDLGPRPYDGHFGSWLSQVIEERTKQTSQVGPSTIRGAEMSLVAGVAHVGDITPSVEAIAARRGARLSGVSYHELYGMGMRQHSALAGALEQLNSLEFETPISGWGRGVVLGLSPHAPYSAGFEVYDWATHLSRDRAYRICTHLAESLEELEFCHSGSGPFRELLEQLGLWDSSIKPPRVHPIQWMEPHLRRGRWLLAHCNYIEDEHIDILQRTGTSVAYCPVASDYFGHRKHRYREMIEQGVNVCLGTDSILCQLPENPQPMSILSQMRYLYRRDEAEPEMLLAMATTHGMLALELSELDATLGKRAPACFMAVPIDPDCPTDPLLQALSNDHPVEAIIATG